MSIQIIYWTGSGNTEKMAEAIAQGLKNKGSEYLIAPVSNIDRSQVNTASVICLGCPSMGAEVLEETEMEPFVDSLSTLNWAGKKLVLFGSYDWGDGQWMREWEDRMNAYGATLHTEGFICRNEPDAQATESLIAIGESLV